MAHYSLPRRNGNRSDIGSRPGLCAKYLDRTRGKRLAGRRVQPTLGLRFFAILLLSLASAEGLVMLLGVGSVVSAYTMDLPPAVSYTHLTLPTIYSV